MTSLSKLYTKHQSEPTGDTEARRKREAKAQQTKRQTNNYARTEPRYKAARTSYPLKLFMEQLTCGGSLLHAE